MKKFFVLLSVLLVLACFSGCCAHSWVEGNCTTPKTCTECGATEGDVVHSFEAKNCTDPAICSACGVTGEPVGHKWNDAGCTDPKICEKCGATEEALGHSTRCGKCKKCGKDINNLAYKDGFAVVTCTDTVWMKEKSDFVDVYVIGMIVEISKYNDVVIVDADEGKWTIAVGTACDLSPYIGTECEVYGFSSGGISSQHNTPLINMDHDNNRIVFVDGKTLYPEDFESTKQFEDKYTGDFNEGGNGTVWIPTDGGSKYHSKATCSGMYNPEQVTEKEAIDRGFGKCGKCW